METQAELEKEQIVYWLKSKLADFPVDENGLVNKICATVAECVFDGEEEAERFLSEIKEKRRRFYLSAIEESQKVVAEIQRFYEAAQILQESNGPVKVNGKTFSDLGELEDAAKEIALNVSWACRNFEPSPDLKPDTICIDLVMGPITFYVWRKAAVRLIGQKGLGPIVFLQVSHGAAPYSRIWPSDEEHAALVWFVGLFLRDLGAKQGETK